MELIKIGDTAVSEEKIVETSTMASPESKEESKNEKQSTSTKKAKQKSQSRGSARAKLIREKEEEKISLFKENIYIFLLKKRKKSGINKVSNFLCRKIGKIYLQN